MQKTEDLSVGDLTLVVGMPETDPLPAEADVTYVGPILWQMPEAELPVTGGTARAKPGLLPGRRP